jgi:ribosome-associated translation inhibitor RaiA
MAVELDVQDPVPDSQQAAARRRFEALSRYADGPIDVRARLRRAHGGRGARPYVVDARLRYAGRELAAHAAGPDPGVAAEEAADRLRRQLRRVVGADVAQRDGPGTLQRALADLPFTEARLESRKPPQERRLVRRRTYAEHPESTYEAISDLIDDAERFHVFVHVRTGEDVTVHRVVDDAHIILLHPQGSALADEADEVVVPKPSRYSGALTLAQARAELDLVRHAFLYFTDADDLRGKVLYLRRDGDYGLVEPR